MSSKKFNFNKWWIYLILVAIFCVPAYTQIPFDRTNTSKVVAEVLRNPLIYYNQYIYIIVKVVFIALACVSIIFKKFNKVFNYFIFIQLIGIAIFQSTAYTESYGLSFLIGNIILFLIVAAAWLMQSINNYENEYKNKIGNIKYLLLALAILAFWCPADNTGMLPNFTLLELVANESMVTFCMVTPVILVISLLYSEKINFQSLRIISFIGLMFGVVNEITCFMLSVDMWWMGILHLPLLIVSLFTFIVSGKELKKISSENK